MQVLLTGAFGNVGSATIRELLAAGHRVRVFELATKRNQKIAAEWGDQIEVVWGDLTRSQEINTAVEGCDAVIHDAAIIPPASEESPDLTYKVNVEGSQDLICACEAQSRAPRFVFASSVTLAGPCPDKPPPRRASEPIAPTDHYTHSKARCEEMLRQSRLDWVIVRLGAVIPLVLDGAGKVDFEFFFRASPDSRVEYVHPADVGLAQTNAICCDEAVGKTLLIGGGESSQILMRDLNSAILEAAGIGALPDTLFGSKWFYTDWMDTEESQRLLQYQRHDFASHARALREQMRWVRRLIRPLRWPLRHYLALKSPYAR